jgi:uncharacterized protein (TIGR02466 family)
LNEFHYFPTAVYREEKPEWVGHVLKQVDRWYQEQRRINQEQNINYAVVQTPHMGNDSELSFLAEYFGKTATDLLRQQGYFLDHHEFYTSGMWAQEVACMGSHEPHVHANTQMCGLYLLDIPEGGSFPVFSDPRPSKLMNDFFMADNEVRVATPKIYFNNMVPGTFMFFNAWLPHQFTINQSQQPTKFVHFTLGCRERTN